MLRAYKYRLYPTDEQTAVLAEMLRLLCWLWNHTLEYRRERWRRSRLGVHKYDLYRLWADWRNELPDENPLRLIPVTTGREVIDRQDVATREAIRGKRGWPVFRSWRRFNTMMVEFGNGVGLTSDGGLRVMSVGRVRVRWHRPLPEGKVKRVLVVRKASGWYAVFQVEIADVPLPSRVGPAVGIDVGLHHALALSDGTIIDSPKYLQQSLKKLRVLQRTVARRKKGSARRWQAVHQLARQQEYVENQRRDFWHKVTADLVRQYRVIVLEDLDLKFMLRNGKLSRHAHDVGLGMFREMLAYKAQAAGVDVLYVNPAYTSQVCSACGCVVEKDLSVRVHECPDCGFTADRDVNAALNILYRGLGRSPQALT